MEQGLQAEAAAGQQVDSAQTGSYQPLPLTHYPVRRACFKRIQRYNPKTVDEVKGLEKEPLLVLYDDLLEYAKENSSLLSTYKINIEYYIKEYQFVSQELKAQRSKTEAYKAQAEDYHSKWVEQGNTTNAYRDAFKQEIDASGIFRSDLDAVRKDLTAACRAIAEKDKEIGDLQHEVNAAYAHQQQAISNLGYIQEEYNTQNVQLDCERGYAADLKLRLEVEKAQHQELVESYNDQETSITSLRQEVRYLQLQLAASEAANTALSAEVEEVRLELEVVQAQVPIPYEGNPYAPTVPQPIYLLGQPDEELK